MKTIRLKFVDYWEGFDVNNNYFLSILKKKYNVEISDNPQYVFFSVFGNEHLRYKDSVLIFYTGENIRPDFNVCDYAIGFDYLSFGDRYIRYPLYLGTAKKGRIDIKCDVAQMAKRDFCGYIVSNGNTKSDRDVFFKLLSEKYKEVASGGKHLNNIERVVDNKLEWLSNFKFSIAFENSLTPGYVTEKITEAYNAWTIPIYRGDPLIKKEFNSKAFINVDDFDSFEDAIEYIKYVDGSDDVYLSMINEKLVEKHLIEKYTDSLEIFLHTIFEQDKTSAIRRTGFGREEMYWDRLIQSAGLE